MTVEEARGLAAQAWCDEPNRNKVVDVNLAESFAKILVKVVNEKEQTAFDTGSAIASGLDYIPKNRGVGDLE